MPPFLEVIYFKSVPLCFRILKDLLCLALSSCSSYIFRKCMQFSLEISGFFPKLKRDPPAIARLHILRSQSLISFSSQMFSIEWRLQCRSHYWVSFLALCFLICHDVLCVYLLDNGVIAPKALLKWLLCWNLSTILNNLKRKFTLFSRNLPRNPHIGSLEKFRMVYVVAKLIFIESCVQKHLLNADSSIIVQQKGENEAPFHLIAKKPSKLKVRKARWNGFNPYGLYLWRMSFLFRSRISISINVLLAVLASIRPKLLIEVISHKYQFC